MRDKVINIGNKAFVNVSKVKYIVSADAEKVCRELAKRNMERASKEVFDGTSAKETRSMLILNDNSIGISSVNATVLTNRVNADIPAPTVKEAEPQEESKE